MKSDTSVLDYLNPIVFQNATLVSEIRRRLHRGELVVIHDAFISDFADYVWEDLSSDEVRWRRYEDYSEDGFIYR